MSAEEDADEDGGGFADGAQFQRVMEDAVLYKGAGFGVAVFQY